MTTPTRQDIINANNALAALICFALSNTAEPDEKDWIKTEGRAIAAVLPPSPRPTMAEVEWVDELHYLAEAEQNIHGQVIMLGLDEDGLVEYFVPRFHAHRYDAARPGTLTPTGRRFTLTEVQK